LAVTEISVRERLPRDLLRILAFACTVHAIVLVVVFGIGYDSHAYWLALQGEQLYGRAPNTADAFLYSPAFAQVVWPLAQLPWPWFAAAFTILPALAFGWMLKPLPSRLAVPLWLATLPEIVTGNVYWLLALAAVFGLRHPATWTVVAFTKITPCLGPVWFLVRREWDRLTVSLVCFLAVLVVSTALDADGWREWLSFLMHHASATSGPLGSMILPPPSVRIPIALVIVVYAAWTDRRWLLPVAMVMATPVIGTASFTMLAAIPRLATHEARVPGDRRHLTTGSNQTPIWRGAHL
jgi:hypothetical protein